MLEEKFNRKEHKESAKTKSTYAINYIKKTKFKDLKTCNIHKRS